MNHKSTLWVDAAINFLLGTLLLIFSDGAVRALGVPGAVPKFYPNLLGGVLMGIGIALVIECLRKEGGMAGLGVIEVSGGDSGGRKPHRTENLS